MATANAHKQITVEVLNWTGMSAVPHRFGGSEFRWGTREIGHLHGDHLLDIPFPKRIRDEIVAAGEAEPHHILPDSGWISFYLREPEDVQKAIALLRRSYELVLERRGK
jgi:hypothetical protein